MYLRLSIYLMLVLFLSACGRPRYLRKANNRVERRAEMQNNGSFETYTAGQYIDQFHDIAIEEMEKYGIPASVTLAQGMLESGNGNSPLARYANNHFGIKCTPDWDGRKYYHDDDRKNDCFRVYKNAEESYRDHSAFLRRKRYERLFHLKSTDYKGWAHGLKKAGYATNPAYPGYL